MLVIKKMGSVCTGLIFLLWEFSDTLLFSNAVIHKIWFISLRSRYIIRMWSLKRPQLPAEFDNILSIPLVVLNISQKQQALRPLLTT
ncbi:hypothetical protein [Metabacillus schmidteae]|uniref:hypothetical protein n=1 Tax=Metabacillus schmidteae TaxID=2730405 RepID=UPI00158C4E5F|nr:hypothetical protein [Metabacillus schmidteae]